MGADEYDDALEQDGRDLTLAARRGRLDPVHFRGALVDRCLAELDQGHSVLLVGLPAVGKSAVIRGVALALHRRGRGRLVEFSTTSMLAGTRYLGEWQTKATRIAQRAVAEKVWLRFTDAWNLPRAGRTIKNDSNLLEALRPSIDDGGLCLLAECTPAQHREMLRVPRFADLFQTIRVEPLSPEEVRNTLSRVAERRKLELDDAGRELLVELTGRFLPHRPQPAPALGLVAHLAERREEARTLPEAEDIDPAWIEEVFCERTGLPDFIVRKEATRKAADIRAWFTERIVGQQSAIEAVIETIALFKAGMHDPNRPLGTFLFVGPTGVGKTELARSLATFLFGSAGRMLRFDLSEYKDFHAFEKLVGSPSDATRPAALVDPVRAQPFQVILLDELEKAHPNVWDLLLPLLDEGRLSPASGEAVDFTNTIVVATSNAGALEAAHHVGFGSGAGEASRRKRMRKGLEAQFRPEFLNRFQHICFFHPLNREQVREVARQELRRVLGRQGIVERNLAVEVGDEALDLVIERGYDSRYGARALKRELQHQLVLPLALTLMEKHIEPGQILKLDTRDGQVRVRRIDTEHTREQRRAAEPVRDPMGRKLGRRSLGKQITGLRSRVAALAQTVGEARLDEERTQLLAQRRQPDFWQDAAGAARAIRDLDRATANLDRLDRLRRRVQGLSDDHRGADTRPRLERLAQNTATVAEAVDLAWREMVCMGEAGFWDALVEVRPLGSTGGAARDLLVGTYQDWARHSGARWDWLHEPMDDEEPALVAIHGHYATGMLRLESGLHRVKTSPKRNDPTSVARVRVTPWTDASASPDILSERGRRGTGRYGGKLRSTVVCGDGLILQNHRTIADNRQLAADLFGAWLAAPASVDAVVRRYDLVEPRIRDFASGFTTGRKDALAGERFHQLLCRRLDQPLAPAPEGPTESPTLPLESVGPTTSTPPERP